MVFEVLSFDGSHRKRKGMGQEGGGMLDTTLNKPARQNAGDGS